jgi:hypothetical protein
MPLSPDLFLRDSHFGISCVSPSSARKIIRIDTSPIHSGGKVAGVVIPPEESKTEQENGTLLQ